MEKKFLIFPKRARKNLRILAKNFKFLPTLKARRLVRRNFSEGGFIRRVSLCLDSRNTALKPLKTGNCETNLS